MSEARQETFLSSGFRSLHYASVTSTNTIARDLSGDRIFVTAEQQTAGRGRRERGWSSPPGNLYCTLRLEDPASPAIAATLSFVAALALSDAILVAAPMAARDLTLKWPNDTLIAGAKVAGILIEGIHGKGGFAVLIGCGVNIANYPKDTPYPATCLAHTDPALVPSILFDALAQSFAMRLGEWNRGLGFAATRKAWLARAAGIGQPVTVRLPGEEIRGRFDSLDLDGRLVLQSATGRRLISAGDVFLL